MADLESFPLDPDRWDLAGTSVTTVEHLGRPAWRFAEGVGWPSPRGFESRDGVLEVDLAVSGERSFHGVAWRIDGIEGETFFVRPHQVGNPDSIQYTPVHHGISSWQLYHGRGFWAPVRFPLGAWFTLRVVVAGARAEVFLDDLATPVLVIGRLRRPIAAGGVAIAVGGPGLHVARFAATREPAPLVGVPDPEPPAHPGVVRTWDISDPFPEVEIATASAMPSTLLGARSWARILAESSGLADVSRLHGLDGDRNTVLARTTIHTEVATIRRLEFGYSDRAVVFLDGRAVYRGDATYRSRDYRFLGSIGYWDALYLPLEPGDHELAIAVSETFGGWGLQARWVDDTSPAGLEASAVVLRPPR